MPPNNPTLMPNKFFELNCTSPNNIIPKPVVMMSFIWPACRDTSATITDLIKGTRQPQQDENQSIKQYTCNCRCQG